MDVKFINTTSSKLSSLSIVNGQLIALSDKHKLYYDLGGVRHDIVPQGNATTYGLVKVSDSYNSSAGTAASGVAASSNALSLVYNALNDELTLRKLSDLTITKATGDSTLYLEAYKCGSIIQLYLQVHVTGNVTVFGKDFFSGKLNKYLPVTTVTAHSFYGPATIGLVIYTDGSMSVRYEGDTDMPTMAGATVNIGFTYLTYD